MCREKNPPSIECTTAQLFLFRSSPTISDLAPSHPSFTPSTHPSIQGMMGAPVSGRIWVRYPCIPLNRGRSSLGSFTILESCRIALRPAKPPSSLSGYEGGRVGRLSGVSAFMKYPRTDTLVPTVVKSHRLGSFCPRRARHTVPEFFGDECWKGRTGISRQEYRDTNTGLNLEVSP